MKTPQLLFICILSFLSFSCKKDGIKTTQLEGVWELKSVNAGTNGTITEYPANNGTFIIFSETSYQTFSNHQVIKSGSFKIMKENSLVTTEKGNRLIYDNDEDQVRTFFSLEGDNLRLYIDAFDAPSTLYKKTNIVPKPNQ